MKNKTSKSSKSAPAPKKTKNQKLAEAVAHKLSKKPAPKKAAPKKVKATLTPATPAPVTPVAPVTPAAAPKTAKRRYVSKTAPDSKYHQRDRSTVGSPVTVVRDICAANPTLKRKDILALCIEKGVNKFTAATQYSLWKAAQKAAK